MTTLPQQDLSAADDGELLDVHSAVLQLASVGAPLTLLLDRITTTLERLLRGSRCAVLILDPTSSVLRHESAPSLPQAYRDAVDGIPPGPDQGSCGTAAHLGEPVVVEDVDTDPRWDPFRPAAAAAGVRACWSVPLIGTARTVLGTFAVYHDVPHRPDQRERVVVERLTYLATIAVEHAAIRDALVESEERFRRAFEDNAVGMALVDTAGRVLRSNRALLDLTGCSPRELAATSLIEFVVVRDRAELTAALDQVWSGGRHSWQVETAVVRPDGTVRAVSVMLSLVRGARGDPSQLCVNLLDITERQSVLAERQARHEAELAQRQAERASRAKSGFVTMISHEMRTPLQAITGFAELLSTLDLDSGRRHEATTHIADGARHLLELVDDTLDLARIEAHALPLTPSAVDAADALTSVVAFLAPVAAVHAVDLVVGDADGSTWADRRRVRQVLINLVANAIRYVGSGGVVHVCSDVDAEMVQIIVADDGPGIAPELRARLFQPFSSFDPQIAERPEGVGLGLVLARALTEAMEGTLTVTSSEGRGTVAAVRLPAVSR